MPTFAANLTTMFAEVPFLERFERAAVAGFRAVEFQFPYAHTAADIRERLDAFDLAAVLFNAPAGDFAAGERGLACLPGRSADFRAAVEVAAGYAAALGVARVHCLAGTAPAGVDAGELRSTFIDNLHFAAAELGRAGARPVIEAINPLDMPGYYLGSTAQALEIVADCGGAVLLQYDLYHAARSGDDIAATLGGHLDSIGHLQIADSPGRHEPGTGDTDFARLFALIDRLGYAGAIGCEYTPRAGTEAGLGWLRAIGGWPDAKGGA